MAEAKRPLKVFLCHASGDKPQVRALYKRLVAEGVDAWLDQEKLLPGQDWRVEIPRAVREADVVVVCLSNNSITKEGYIQKELRFALDVADEKPEGAIFIIPARLEDCPVPDKLSRWHWVDLFEENGYAKLLRSLKKDADFVGAFIGLAAMEESDEERDRRIEQLYTEGLAAYYTEDWDRACQRFQLILREQPNHRNALEKLEEAELQRDLSKLYLQSTQAYQAGNWRVAIQTLDELLKKKPEYRDAAHLIKNARQQKQLAELYAEAGKLHAAQKWQAVVRIFDRIHAIDPNHPDTEALLSSSQKELAEIQRLAELNDLYTKGIREMDAGNWYEARPLLEKVHKAQTGYLETERLLKKIEAEIVKIEERKKRNDQVNLLYEQAHGLVRSKNWRRAAGKIEEIRKLDSQFIDKDGLAEKINAALALEEQEAQKQNQLAAMYADAVRLLKEEKYQEALDKWHDVRAIDPKYPDRQWVERTAKRKLGEASRAEVAGQPWSKMVSGWLGGEANISADREIGSEKLLLISFVVVGILNELWVRAQSWLHVWEWESVNVHILSFVIAALWGGLWGTVVAFALNKTIYNWQMKHSLTVIAGWVLAIGMQWLIGSFIEANLLPVLIAFSSLATAAAIKWAKPATSPLSIIIILVGWAFAWWTGEILGGYLSAMYSAYYYSTGNALTVLLGLLFTFGILTENPPEVLRTALFGALGFAVGRYVGYLADTMLSLPAEITLPLWGLIGGAILEAPSRNTRRIAIAAGVCGAGLLAGSLITEEVLPNFQYANTAYQDWNNIIWQLIWGAGIGLALGAMIRRPSAIGVMVILGAGMFMVTRALNVGMPDLSVFWKLGLRGGLIGLVLGYGYEYLGNAGSPAGKLQFAKIWLILLGTVGILLLTGWLLTLRSPADTVRIRVITSSDWTTVKLLSGAQLEDVKILSSSSEAINASFDGEIFGLNQLLEQAGSNIVSMTAEAVLANAEPGVPLVFEIDRGGIGKTTIELSNVVGQPALAQTLVFDDCCAPTPPQYEVPVELFMRSPYRWDFDNSSEGWGDEFTNDISIPLISNGSLTFNSTGTGAEILSPGSLNIHASSTPVITVRMRVIQEQDETGLIYFVTNNDNNWDDTKVVPFFVGKGNGTFQVYNILMSTSPNWKDVITQFRLDPNHSADAQISIDYISVHAP